MNGISQFFLRLIGKVAAIAALFFLAKAEGRKDEQIKNYHEQEKANEEVRKIHYKIEFDPEYRERIRSMFDPNKKP